MMAHAVIHNVVTICKHIEEGLLPRKKTALAPV
jgi:hypothetical protein